MLRRMVVALSVVLLGAAAGCGDDEDGGAAAPSTSPSLSSSVAPTTAVPTTVPATTGPPTTAALSGMLTVMAPGPFKALLEKAKAAFEAANPGVTVQLNLGHVPTLLTQLEGGVPGDVLVTPDAGTMGQAKSKGLVSGEAIVIGGSQMALVVPAGNPAAVKDVTALADEALRVAVCADELPCGKLATELARKNGLALQPDSLEPGGSPGVVTKASTGEIDVGLVFATDVAAGGAKVEKVAIPEAANVSSVVSTATVEASGNPSAAAALVAFLASPAGLELVTGSGFVSP